MWFLHFFHIDFQFERYLKPGKLKAFISRVFISTEFQGCLRGITFALWASGSNLSSRNGFLKAADWQQWQRRKEEKMNG
jgi:hypothetical protein